MWPFVRSLSSWLRAWAQKGAHWRSSKLLWGSSGMGPGNAFPITCITQCSSPSYWTTILMDVTQLCICLAHLQGRQIHHHLSVFYFRKKAFIWGRRVRKLVPLFPAGVIGVLTASLRDRWFCSTFIVGELPQIKCTDHFFFFMLAEYRIFDIRGPDFSSYWAWTARHQFWKT